MTKIREEVSFIFLQFGNLMSFCVPLKWPERFFAHLQKTFVYYYFLLSFEELFTYRLLSWIIFLIPSYTSSRTTCNWKFSRGALKFLLCRYCIFINKLFKKLQANMLLAFHPFPVPPPFLCSSRGMCTTDMEFFMWKVIWEMYFCSFIWDSNEIVGYWLHFSHSWKI